MSAGSYEIQAFFDYTGDFLPTFKFRELPEKTDVGGGDIDTADALKPINNGNPDYSPHFLPIEVGTPEPLDVANPSGAALPPGYIPPYDMPSNGYVTNNVTVSLGQVLTDTRPYFYAQGIPSGQGTTNGSLGSMTLSSDGNTIMNTAPTQSSDLPLMNTTGIPNSAEAGGTDPADFSPILTIPQDILTLSAPNAMGLTNALAANANVNMFEAVLPHINLKFGVATDEVPCAAPAPGATGNPCSAITQVPGQTDPYHFQLNQNPTAQGTFSVWQNAYFDPTTQTWNPLQIPEGNNAPMLWPEIILSKLVDSSPGSNPPHIEDPASLTAQGAANLPVVIIQGITLLNPSQPAPMGIGNAGQPDTLYNTVLGEGSNQLLASAEGMQFTPFDPSCSSATPPASCYNGNLFNYQTGQPTVIQQDHLTVAIRPAAICFAHLFDNPAAVDTRGTLVSPFSQGAQASYPSGDMVSGPIVPTDILSNGDLTHRYQVTNLVKNVQFGCLPKGRYAINVVYPDGQAWTVPNEAGGCSGTEGYTDYGGLTCTLKPRPVLYSQGSRAVVEIVGPTDPNNCVSQQGPAASTTFTPTTVTGAAPAVPVDCLPRCETQACPGPDACTQVTDPNTMGPAMVCIPP
jgi:hypothetical protein